MKIAIVTEYYYPSLGGITEHVHHFSLEAKKLGHEPVIITGDAGVDPLVDPASIRIVRLGKSVPMYSNGSVARVTVGLNIGKKMRQLFEKERFDILHIHPPFVPTLPAIAQVYANTITVGTFHTQFDNSNYLKAFRRPAQKAFDCMHGRIAVSESCIESFHKYLKGGMRVIPNGVDTEKFNGEAEKIPEFTDGKKNIFFLSRLEPRNGLEYLIGAFSELRKKRNDCRLIIGGDGPLKNHFRSMVPSFAKNDIHFLGRINGVRPSYYSTADIFCFPTTKASFGITILEAMASKKPVVAFSLPAYKNILTHGKEGILCGEPSVENLTEALDDLLDSPEKRRDIGEAARIRAEEFAWSRITKEIIDYYEELKKIS